MATRILVDHRAGGAVSSADPNRPAAPPPAVGLALPEPGGAAAREEATEGDATEAEGAVLPANLGPATGAGAAPASGPAVAPDTLRGAARHPEKAHRPDNPIRRKPDWIRVKAPTHPIYHETRNLMRDNKLVTVCEEAACPNIGECWSQRHATMMIMGGICTRACAFCNIATGMPKALDPDEPRRVADAVAKLGLRHVVVTSVDRDDLRDGGAAHFAATIAALRLAAPETTVEILTPDFLRKDGALEVVVAARPDVFNHNLETVPKLYPTIRPGARYYHSLRLLDRVKQLDPSIFTKSGVMVGLGEERSEVLQVMDDMRSAEIDFLTIGQYLQPTVKHAAVDRFVEPAEFADYAAMARAKGFLLVSATPLTRSSYHADRDFAALREARAARLAGRPADPAVRAA